MKRAVKYFLILVLITTVTAWYLFREQQAELKHIVSGKELLEVRAICESQAKAKLEEWNEGGLAIHFLEGHGYSEFRGTCYAEFLRWWEVGETYKILYDLTDQRELTYRRWDDDFAWYQSDFDRLILGKTRIIDLRRPTMF